MPSREISREAVLLAYAEARSRADASAAQDDNRLETARQAVVSAENNELKVISKAYDRACLDAYRDFERDMRTAGNNHGLAMTLAVEALDSRRREAEANRRNYLAPFLSRAETASESSAQQAPLLDDLDEAQETADVNAEQEKEAAYEIYLTAKNAEGLLLAETTESLLNRRQEAIQTALDIFQRDKDALMVPLIAAVKQAEEDALAVERQAAAAKKEARKARQAIFRAYEEGLIDGREAVLQLRLS